MNYPAGCTPADIDAYMSDEYGDYEEQVRDDLPEWVTYLTSRYPAAEEIYDTILDASFWRRDHPADVSVWVIERLREEREIIIGEHYDTH
jgi:hypothetical protein